MRLQFSVGSNGVNALITGMSFVVARLIVGLSKAVFLKIVHSVSFSKCSEITLTRKLCFEK